MGGEVNAGVSHTGADDEVGPYAVNVMVPVGVGPPGTPNSLARSAIEAPGSVASLAVVVMVGSALLTVDVSPDAPQSLVRPR
jgi:hypothetical protein